VKKKKAFFFFLFFTQSTRKSCKKVPLSVGVIRSFKGVGGALNSSQVVGIVI